MSAMDKVAQTIAERNRRPGPWEIRLQAKVRRLRALATLGWLAFFGACMTAIYGG